MSRTSDKDQSQYFIADTPAQARYWAAQLGPVRCEYIPDIRSLLLVPKDRDIWVVGPLEVAWHLVNAAKELGYNVIRNNQTVKELGSA